jgi:hypothetical protein
MEFVENPYVHPITKARIVPGSGTYNKCVNECILVLGENGIPAIIANNALMQNDKPTKKKANQQACVRMINDSMEHNQEKPNARGVTDPFMDNRKPRIFPIESREAQMLLDTCKNQFGILYLDVNVHTIRIPVFLRYDSVANSVIVTNKQDILNVIAAAIERWTRNAPDHALYDAMISAIQKLVDSNIFDQYTRLSFEDMVMELQAMKAGVTIGNESAESSLSSSLKSANRSKSKSAPPGLSPLPKKTRGQVLEDLERACIDMQDMITLEDFADMKKKKLQLVIGIGPNNRDGQQRCYYVKNIYNFIKSTVKQGLVAKEPMSKVPITQHEIETVIMPKMRYIQPDARDPGYVEKRKYPALVLDISNVIHRDTRRPYFSITLKRLIGRQVHWMRLIGYIAADIETDSADVNSFAVIAKIRDLFDKGRLVDGHMHMRAHLNKSVEYWDDNDVHKLHLMIEELNSL